VEFNRTNREQWPAWPTFPLRHEPTAPHEK
jgi:hypothetical protein